MRIEVEADSLAPRWVDYYDQRGQVVKRLTLSEYFPVGERRIPLEMVVEDRAREGAPDDRPGFPMSSLASPSPRRASPSKLRKDGCR